GIRERALSLEESHRRQKRVQVSSAPLPEPLGRPPTKKPARARGRGGGQPLFARTAYLICTLRTISHPWVFAHLQVGPMLGSFVFPFCPPQPCKGSWRNAASSDFSTRNPS